MSKSCYATFVQDFSFILSYIKARFCELHCCHQTCVISTSRSFCRNEFAVFCCL